MWMSPNQNGIFIRTSHDIKKDLRLGNRGALRGVAVSNGEMISIHSPSSLVHTSVAHTQNTREKAADISVGVLSKDELERVHVSTCARHCIVSSKEGENFYINLRTNTLSPIKKMKGTITTVAWNPDVGNVDTGHILLGTSKGMIIETFITSSTGKETFVKEHQWNGGDKDKELPISNLYLFSTNDDDIKQSRWVLIICIPGRLITLQATLDASPRSQYVGNSSLNAGWGALPEKELHIFAPLLRRKDPYCIKDSCDITSPLCSSLSIYPDSKVPDMFKFVWLCPSGLTVGSIHLQAHSLKSMIKEDKTIDHGRVDGSIEWPLSISLTEYHVILLFNNRLLALSFYTGNVVYEDIWPRELGEGVGLTFDETSHMHWLYTTNSLLKYRPNDETRYVWNIYLERGDYARANNIARERRSIDSEAYELVLRRQAEKYIMDKNYGGAGEILAQSSESFENVVLRLIIEDDVKKTGLKTLLDKKLEQLREPEDRMKRDTLFMWLLEMQLCELAEAKKELLSINVNKVEAEEKIERLTRQLHAFLMRKNIQETIQKLKKAIYRMMHNHADLDSQLFVATLLKDFEEIIRIRISREQYGKALTTLVSIGSCELFYQFSPLLLPHISSSLIDALKNCPSIRPQKIIPLLCEVSTTETTRGEVLSYLESCLSYSSSSQSLHNLLISLLSRMNHKRLMEYLEKQGRDRSEINYDLEYAMRTVKQYDIKEAQVFLYCVGEMWMEAVEMSLEKLNDLKLAKSTAEWMDSCMDDGIISFTNNISNVPNETRKAIWLKIARYMIESSEDIGSCLDVLTLSRDAIKIQDLLPLLPDFTKMEELKEPLVACLKDHSTKIALLQQQMKDATENANEMRAKTEKMKKRVTVVRSSDICNSCRLSLCTRPFYAYSCRHVFHRDCLERETVHFRSEEEDKILDGLIAKERRVLTELEYGDRKGGRPSEYSQKEDVAIQISSQIGDILGRECPLCSNLAIDLLDVPFFNEDEYRLEYESWLY